MKIQHLLRMNLDLACKLNLNDIPSHSILYNL